MYSQILLAYDGSREGRAALREGAEIATRCQATTHLLAVVRPLPSLSMADGIVPENYFAEERRQVQEVLDDGVALLKQRGLEAQGHLAYGEPAEQIASLASALGAHLIVLGHRNRSRIARWWGSGSVSASILERAPCSILIAVSNPSTS